MATDNHHRFGLLDALGFLAFLVGVAFFLLVSAKAGMRVFGFWMIAGAILQHLSGRGVPYGWEGQPPRGHVTGWLAHFFNGAMAAVGLAMLVWPEVGLGTAGWEEE